MLRRFEKKLNAWIIDLLVAGTTDLEEKTAETDSAKVTSIEKVKDFLKGGIDQMSKELGGTSTTSSTTDTESEK